MITPLILGSGRSGDAIAKSLLSIQLMRPELSVTSPIFLKRGASLSEERKKIANKSILCIANPHGLHANTILEAESAGFDAVICEKPACVTLEQVQSLRKVKIPTAILHVYRQMWGIQTLKEMINQSSFGEIITIEGRYWQSSTAERALKGPQPSSWKNDVKLSGESDAYLDVGCHWIDAASFLLGSTPEKISGWRSFVNAETPHRDSHVQIHLQYPKAKKAFASISKTFHGATNHFEINIIGSKKSATWKFLEPDEILIGEGRDRIILTRKTAELGSGQPPFHALGWLEGYIEISYQLLQDAFKENAKSYPKLQDNLDMLEIMLKTEWSP